MSLALQLRYLLPEISVVAAIVGLTVLHIALLRQRKNIPLGVLLAMGAGILASIFYAQGLPPTEAPLLGGMFILSPTLLYFKGLTLVSAVAVGAVAYHSHYFQQHGHQNEFLIVLMGATLGVFTQLSAQGLLMLWISTEMVSLPSYLLAAFYRANRSSAEAGMKYVIFGAFSSGCMIYGISWLYGMPVAQLSPEDALLPMGLVLAGLFFKIGAAPMHFWLPDIYEGSPYPVAAFLSVAPKIGGFVLLFRFVDAFSHSAHTGLLFKAMAVLAMLSMTLGNLSALRQTNFRRMLAYSGIAHSGFMLMAIVCTPSPMRNGALHFYLSMYAVLVLATFLMAGEWEERHNLTDTALLKGTAKRFPLETVLTTLFMAGLIGLPPTGGFIAKWYLFSTLSEDWNNTIAYLPKTWIIILLVAGVLNTLFAVYYYLRIPALMVFSGGNDSQQSLTLKPFLRAIITCLAGLSIVLGIIGFDKLIAFLQ